MFSETNKLFYHFSKTFNYQKNREKNTTYYDKSINAANNLKKQTGNECYVETMIDHSNLF